MKTIVPFFTVDQAERAYAEWGCNCGPSALAAACGLPLDHVRPVLPGFEAKRYTNPSMMLAALRTLKHQRSIADFSVAILSSRQPEIKWPDFGLARIQWEGPWTAPGVPMAARYRRTHWIGVQKHPSNDELAIFDVNAMCVGGVVTYKSWAATLVPHILQTCVPDASGEWHVTHAIEVRR